MDTINGRQSQRLVIQAIQEYTDRHNANHQSHEKGVNDLMTLQSCNPPGLIQKFNSSLQNGLTSAQVKINGQIYGVNQYRKRRKISLWEIFKEALCDEMLIILMISAAISVVVEYIAGEQKDMFWVDGVSILIAVIVCTSVATFSNYQKEKQFTELDQMTQNTYNYDVIRDGKRVEIHRREIVPGDMILVSNGMQIPADCILYKAVNVLVNESAVTGESVQLEKNTFEKCMERRMDVHGPSPYMISGSNIVSGQGMMMAAVVGKESQAGKNYELIFGQEDDGQQNQTPLERKLQEIGAKIGYFGIISAIIIFIVLVLRLVIQQLQHGGFNFKENINKLVSFLIIAVSIVVVAVPEGLPLAVTLTLAYSMKAMHDDKILVRKLASCQTMGAAKFICSDKTGTITQNKMNVMHVVNVGGIPISQFTPNKMDKGYFEKLMSGIFHNSSAIVETEKGPQTQIALLKMANKLTGKSEVDVRNQVGTEGYFYRLPFDSTRKRMTTGLKYAGRDLIFMNGASQQILQTCDTIQNYQTGQVSNLSPQIRQGILQEIDAMANRGLRTLSVAYKPINDRRQLTSSSIHKPQDGIEEIQKRGFTLLGVFGIEDPPRPESKQSIQDCRDAGIHVIMVTGDNKITAQSISKQVGIIKGDGKGGKIMQASQFMKRLESLGLLKQQTTEENDDEDMKKSVIQQNFSKLKKVHFADEGERKKFADQIENLVVLARSKPQHKYILVDGINKLGHVVAVTGDGSNDAPALMRADIGLAMGVTGTQVAKNASDIVLLDDNFSSIVRSVVWGRNVYLSIRKFLQFQLTVNLVAVAMCLISAAVIKQSVFPAVQMLWVNLIMDSLAALALATEPPNASQLLKQKPNSPDEGFITKTMLKHIVGQAIFQVAVLIILLFLGHSFIPESKDQFDGVIGSDLQAKYFNGVAEGTVTDGRFYTVSGEDNYHKWFKKYRVHSRHFTFIFNAFVFLQIFNFVCCRRIKDELWLLKNIHRSTIFIFILIAITILQVLLVTFGGKFFQVYKYHGLNLPQWLLSVGIGLLTIPVSLFLRVLPFAKPEQFVHDEDDQKEMVWVNQNGYSVVRE